MRRFFIVCLLVLAGFASCKKTKGPANGKSVQPNNNLDSTVSISATINGVSWQSDSAFGYYVKTSDNDSGKVNLMIVGINKSGTVTNTLVFIINNFTGLNTYSIIPPFNSATYYKGSARHYASIGQLVVNSDTAYSLKGTFNFIADSFSVTNGVFNVARP